MCPFCIAALAAIGAKTLAAGGGAALAAKLALKRKSLNTAYSITAEADELRSDPAETSVADIP